MSPDRPLIDIFNTSGVLVARLGDITGMPWGGAGFTLPSGTYGLWTKRDGAWMKGQVTMFYAHAGQLSITFDPPGTGTANQPGVKLVLDETFPFGTINIPSGRIVTWEYLLYEAALQARFGTPQTVQELPAVLLSKRLRASRNGGAVSDWDFLTGPATLGTDAYTSVAIRTEWWSAVGGNLDQDTNMTFRRRAMIRIFSHEVNSALTFSQTTSYVADPGGGAAGEGFKGDPGGGAGSDSGGYQGDAGDAINRT